MTQHVLNIEKNEIPRTNRSDQIWIPQDTAAAEVLKTATLFYAII